MRSRLTAPPPQQQILAAARGPNNRTPDPTRKGLAFIFKAKEATPQGCPRDQSRARPGRLPCTWDGYKTITKKSFKGIIAAKIRGAAPLTPGAPSPEGRAGGEAKPPPGARSAAKQHWRAKGKRKGPPKGPRANSRAWQAILYHKPGRKSRKKCTSPRPGARDPNAGEDPPPAGGRASPRRPGPGPRPPRGDATAPGGTPGTPDPPGGPKRPPGQGRRRPARERGKGTGGDAQGRPPAREPADARRPAPQTDTAGGAARRRAGAISSGKESPPGAVTRRGEAPQAGPTQRARSPQRPRDGDGDKTRGGGPRGEGDGTGPKWRNNGGGGGDQRRPDPPRGPTLGGARDEAQPRGNRLSPKRLPRGRRGGVPPEGP